MRGASYPQTNRKGVCSEKAYRTVGEYSTQTWGLTRDEEVVKSMVDHPAGRRCHGDEEELDLPFLHDGDEPWRVPLEWIFDGFCLLVALIMLFVSITTFGVL